MYLPLTRFGFHVLREFINFWHARGIASIAPVSRASALAENRMALQFASNHPRFSTPRVISSSALAAFTRLLAARNSRKSRLQIESWWISTFSQFRLFRWLFFVPLARGAFYPWTKLRCSSTPWLIVSSSTRGASYGLDLKEKVNFKSDFKFNFIKLNIDK